MDDDELRRDSAADDEARADAEREEVERLRVERRAAAMSKSSDQTVVLLEEWSPAEAGEGTAPLKGGRLVRAEEMVWRALVEDGVARLVDEIEARLGASTLVDLVAASEAAAEPAAAEDKEG